MRFRIYRSCCDNFRFRLWKTIMLCESLIEGFILYHYHCWRNLKLIQDFCFGVLSKGAMRWGCQWSLRCGVCTASLMLNCGLSLNWNSFWKYYLISSIPSIRYLLHFFLFFIFSIKNGR